MCINKVTVNGICTCQALKAISMMPNCFVPTGSRIYGGATDESDYDFIVNPKVTWWGGEVMEGLLQSWTYAGEGGREHTLVCASEDYAPDEAVARDPSEFPVGDGSPMVYLQDIYGVPMINLVFPESEKAFHAWCEATLVLASLRGEDAERIKAKAARVLAFRVLRRQIEKGLK